MSRRKSKVAIGISVSFGIVCGLSGTLLMLMGVRTGGGPLNNAYLQGISEAPMQLHQIPDRYVEMVLPPPAPGGVGGLMEPVEDAPAFGRLAMTGEDKDARSSDLLTRSEPAGNKEAGKKGPGRPERSSAGAPTRAWFPETFLWAPAVVTDDAGHATLAITLPDSLSRWRVLGLSATRDGVLSGAEHSVVTQLPVSVDVLLPETLTVGDRIAVPVWLTNRTDAPVTEWLVLETAGLAGAASGDITVPAGEQAVQWFPLDAPEPGSALVTARLGDRDAVRREATIRPRGRAVTTARGGLLGGVSEIALAPVEGSVWGELKLSVFAGPLGVLRQELARPLQTGAAGGAAYAYALGARGATILDALGADVDDDTRQELRTLRLQALQGLARQRCAGDPGCAAAVVALRSGEDPVAERLTGLWGDTLERAQLPDGSWKSARGTTLQQLLVLSATLTRAVDTERARVRVAGLFERHGGWLQGADPYTLAVVLGSGAVNGELESELRELLRSFLVTGDDGAVALAFEPGPLRGDGRPVTPADALAAAAQVLDGETRQALIGALIAGFSPRDGFGDGHTGLAALDALALAGGEPPDRVLGVTLKQSDDPVLSLSLRPETREELVVRTAPTSGDPTYHLTGDAWPGLAWHLERTDWVPWSGLERTPGLDISADHGPARVGEAVPLVISVSGPRETALAAWMGLPTGVTAVTPSASSGVIVTTDSEGVNVKIPAPHPQRMEVTLTVVPSLAGEIWSGPAVVFADADPEKVTAAPPERWSITPR